MCWISVFIYNFYSFFRKLKKEIARWKNPCCGGMFCFPICTYFIEVKRFWLMKNVDIINNLFGKIRMREREREKTYPFLSTCILQIDLPAVNPVPHIFYPLNPVFHWRDGTINPLFPSLFTTHQSTIQQTKIHTLLSLSLSLSNQKQLANLFFTKGFFFFFLIPAQIS